MCVNTYVNIKSLVKYSKMIILNRSESIKFDNLIHFLTLYLAVKGMCNDSSALNNWFNSLPVG